jgi:hypothetical protein
MDFTKINNDGEGIERVPKAVLNLLAGLEMDYEYSTQCVRDVDEEGRTIYEVGIKDAGENMNEAPYLAHDYSYLIDTMEKFKQGDDEGADEGFIRLMNDVPEVTPVRRDARRDPISRAETNAEMCIFNTRDFEVEAQGYGYRGIAFLNPSVGTIKRFSQIYPKASVPVFISEIDADYVRRISNLCTSLKLAKPQCVPVVKLDPCYIYYMGFRADKIFGYNSARLQQGKEVLTYIGFTPNLLAMACANVEILSYSEFDQRFVYLRKSEEISVDMTQHVSMVRADALSHDFAKLKYYKRTQGILHDLVASLDWVVEVPVIKARPIPVGVLVPVYSGVVDKRHDGIFIAGNMIIDDRGVKIPEAWCKPAQIADHRYLSGEYHGAIYDAGRVERVISLEEYMLELNSGASNDELGEGFVGVSKTKIKKMLKNDIFHEGSIEYVRSPTGAVRLRENRKGTIVNKKKRYNKEIVSNYVIGIETAIEYTGDRLEMYGVEHVDMTVGNLEITGGLKDAGEDIEFGAAGS